MFPGNVQIAKSLDHSCISCCSFGLCLKFTKKVEGLVVLFPFRLCMISFSGVFVADPAVNDWSDPVESTMVLCGESTWRLNGLALFQRFREAFGFIVNDLRLNVIVSKRSMDLDDLVLLEDLEGKPLGKSSRLIPRVCEMFQVREKIWKDGDLLHLRLTLPSV